MINITKKKITAILLIISIFLLLIMQSCANSANNANNNGTSSDNNTNNSGEIQTTSPETTEYKAAAEPFDWGGKQFTVLVNNTGNSTWLDVDFTCEEQNGDPINDAVYKRNMEIEDMFNIKIVPVPVDQGAHVTNVRKAVKAGDNAYDVAFNDPFDNATLSQEGDLYDLFNVPNLDLTQPWWDQNSVSDLSIGHKLYEVTGDIGTMYKKSVGILLFNKQMIQDYALGNPYQLVQDKKWTMDAFLTMCKAVSQDLNGDGKWDENDRYGLLGYCDMIAISLIGGGVKFATKNADDIPEITFYSDKTVNIFNKITNILYDKSLFWSWSATGKTNEVSQAMFENGQGLFCWNEFHA
ncbi:MAG: extracellular solute-binding protein, partial [Oscillospiraceae bacterium]|nr:extracellular solute-binding protein [Oscillospiraceae bacterium]